MATRMEHGYALLWDAHSIASEVPRLFEGLLPDPPPGGLHYERWYHADGLGAMKDAQYREHVGAPVSGGQTHASALPTAVFPAPIMPTITTVFFSRPA